MVDRQVNGRESVHVIELSEQTIIEQVVERLRTHFPSVSPETVASVVQDNHARFEGRPLREYVPLFVERSARRDLAQLG
jgi:hypothetical protein